MRHGRYVKKLGVKRQHREAMLSNMATSIINSGKIKTTSSRAKVLQSRVERLVTLGKRGDLHSRRLAYSVLRDRSAVKKLFDQIASEFKSRNGGFTRRAFLGRRPGDGASLSVVELNIEKKFVEEKKKKEKKSAAAGESPQTVSKEAAAGKKKAAAGKSKG